MHLVHDLLIFMTALFAALIMVPFLRQWALERGEVDVPDARKVHTRPIPRLGGIAIFMSALFSCLMFMDLDAPVRGILAGALVVFFTGLVDDLHGISPKVKFLGEVTGCLVTISVGNLYIARLGDLFGVGPISLPLWLAVPFTLFAVVGVINALNLIDGLDGLAGGVSVIALVGFSILALLDGNLTVLALCAALLGGLLGFLKYNFFPARIFMGDAGSLAVGFLLAFFAILLTQSAGANTCPMAPVIILGLPIVDTLWVMIRRVAKGASPFSPDRTHVHHKILDLGFQHRFTVILIYGISFLGTVFALAFRKEKGVFLLGTYLFVTLCFYLALRYVLRHRDTFSFLRLDSPHGIRESAMYQRLSDKAGFVAPLLMVLVLLYLGLSLFPGSPGSENLRITAGLVTLAGAFLLYLTRDPENHYCLALIYSAGLVVTFAVEPGADRLTLFGTTLHRISDVIFLLAGLLVAFKAFFRRPGEFFLTTIDFLLLGISIVLAGLFFKIPFLNFLLGPFLKGIVLFLAIKTISTEGKREAGIMVCAVLAATLMLSLRGFFM